MSVSPYVLLSLTAFFWSLNFIIGKMLSDVIPPITVSFLRWLLPFALFLLLDWKDIHANRATYVAKWRTILILGATGYCLNSIGVYEAVKFTSVINTSFINAFQPVLIVLAGYLWNREKVNRLQGIGISASMFGVLYIVFQGKLAWIVHLRVDFGDLFMLISICLWSIHTIIYKNEASELPMAPTFTLMMMGGLVITLPMALAESTAYHWSWVSRMRTVDVVGILALNIFPSVLAYQFWNNALKRISANQVGIFLYLIPIYTTILSVLFFGEKLELYHLIGGALILVGLLLVTNVSLLPKSIRHQSP